jgi:hypothetical protein
MRERERKHYYVLYSMGPLFAPLISLSPSLPLSLSPSPSPPLSLSTLCTVQYCTILFTLFSNYCMNNTVVLIFFNK